MFDGPEFSWNKDDLSLEKDISGLSFDYAGGACPVQAEGMYNDEKFYFRYRWGIVSLSFDKEDAILNPSYEASMVYGDQMGGTMTKEEFEEIFMKLFNTTNRGSDA